MNSMLRCRIFTLCIILTAVMAGDCGASFLEELARPQSGRSMRVTSTGKLPASDEPDPNSNHDNSSVAPGQTKVLMDVQGPGVITHIWITFLEPEPHPWAKNGSADHQQMLLRIYWDGKKRPAVEAPVGDFFANCFGKRSEVISLPVIVEDADSYNCFWRMPFRKSARIEIVNQSEKPISLLYYNIDWIKKKSMPKDTPYFYAQYRQEYPVQKGKDYVLLETKGKGHYVGTVLSVRTRSPAWFGEGDEKIYIDGEKKPSIWGTGTEDYFLSAWGLKTTSTPYFGVPYFDSWGIVGGHTSAYRWHINDPIVFNTAVKVTFEHYGWLSPDENPGYKSDSWNEREDDYASVAFWYQTGEPTFDARAPDGAERRLPNLDLVFPARQFIDKQFYGEGQAVAQELDIYYPGGQLLYMPPAQQDAWLEIQFEVKVKEPKRLLLNLTSSYDYGKYQPFLDGVKIGPVMDLYSGQIKSGEYHLLDFWPEPGKYKLRLECVGRNPLSTGYYLGIESVRLRERRPRVKDYGHDRDKNWRENPVLYE